MELGRCDVTGKFISCDLPDLELLQCSGRPGRAASVARISPIASSFLSIFFSLLSIVEERAGRESERERDRDLCREHGGFFFTDAYSDSGFNSKLRSRV